MGCCCVKEEQSKLDESSDSVRDGQNTLDYKIQKGDLQINVNIGDIANSQSKFIVTTCDTNGRSPNSNLLEKNQNLRLKLEEQHNDIGEVIYIPQSSQNYIFLVLPLYLGDEEQFVIFKKVIQRLLQLLLRNPVETVAIEDIGVGAYGYPRQFVSKTLIETFSDHLSQFKNLNSITFISRDAFTKQLFEADIQARRQQMRDASKPRGSFEQDKLQSPLLN